MKNTLNHIAIIPDGNRRWAKTKGFATMVGHEKGADAFEKVLEKAIDLKIPYITLWGLSLDNVLKRSKLEINYIYNIIENQFKRIGADERTHKNKIRVEVIGRYKEYFPKETQKVIEETIEKTKKYDKFVLTFLLVYNGTDEIVECVKKIQEKKAKTITEKTIKDNLWTKDLPAVDLIIRTGVDNDPHLSAGFMMWDAAYAQLHFTKTYFPAFNQKEFEKIVLEYSERQRRKGA
jgi:undecaprenyl diphosphate synthase